MPLMRVPFERNMDEAGEVNNVKGRNSSTSERGNARSAIESAPLSCFVLSAVFQFLVPVAGHLPNPVRPVWLFGAVVLAVLLHAMGVVRLIRQWRSLRPAALALNMAAGLVVGVLCILIFGPALL